MKKLVCLVVCLFLFLPAVTAYAGDIPESLLWEDCAQVYFGEVKHVDGKTITVVQYKNIKGDFAEGREIAYSDFVFTDSPKAGEIYLCGFLDENNPLYIWEVSSLDTKTLKIKRDDDFAKRMQEYLNSGQFEEKEKERLAKLEGETDARDAFAETDVHDRRQSVGTRRSDAYLKYVLPVLVCLIFNLFLMIQNARNRNR